MLPYFSQTSFSIGPVHIFVWGLMVALGLVVCLWALVFETRARGLSYERVLDMAVWTIVGAFVGARLGHILFYEPAFFWAHPEEIFQVWHGGLASVGGITAGVGVAVWYVWKHKLPIKKYGDAVCRIMPAAWAIARTGCYLTHMHPGVHVRAWFAVAYPDGGRLDLGLLEAVFWLMLGVVFWVTPRSKQSGIYIVFMMVLYGVARFILDFFRATDVMMSDARYGGLTAAQYAMLVLCAGGVYLAVRWRIYKKI